MAGDSLELGPRRHPLGGRRLRGLRGDDAVIGVLPDYDLGQEAGASAGTMEPVGGGDLEGGGVLAAEWDSRLGATGEVAEFGIPDGGEREHIRRPSPFSRVRPGRVMARHP
ncbi:hypothetical protein [Kitasatospora purpeofusca]|uniref:Uncharacterized protein n=1 Tax=Kitasatospora purpeofusca TaxID=67352 RepID=A0ABZ1TVL8_9ACTN|nr:hypothetical protein [Kitasatospora purpeofusca]